jgi:hypothetical protein
MGELVRGEMVNGRSYMQIVRHNERRVWGKMTESWLWTEKVCHISRTLPQVVDGEVGQKGLTREKMSCGMRRALACWTEVIRCCSYPGLICV